jgi:peptide deformylase
VSLLPIRVFGDPILREETVLVEDFGPELQRLIDDMFETMHAARGIGLAAPQIGRRERLAVVDVDDHPLVLVNPEIVSFSSATDKKEEGCLSIPEVYGDVQRPSEIVMRALDRTGAAYDLEASELLARCIQHEVDHLHGRLFVDYLSVLKRRAAMSKWAKERDKYPSFVRVLTPEEVAEHHHRDEEL